MRARLAAALALLPGLAAADPHKVLVLQAEGRADAGLRAQINTAIVRLATAAQLQASAGELTFTDAATAVGCRPDAPACKDEVISMLSVDEIVLTTVTPKPGGVEIAIQRIAKGGAARDATMLLSTGASVDKLDRLASVFGAASAAGQPPAGAKAGPPSDRSAAPASAAIAPGPPPSAGRSSPGIDRAPPASPPAAAAIAPAAPAEPPPVIPAPAAVPPASPAVPETAPAAPTDQPSPPDHRLELAGMIGGGGLLVLGVVLWGAASSTQDDINRAPTRTSQDLANLKDLESRGDVYAAAGNVLVAAGAVVGGIATYLYIRDRRAGSAATARLVPTVLDHGAGLVLTLGGMP